MIIETYIDNGIQWAFNFSVDVIPNYINSITFPSINYVGIVSTKIPVWVISNGTT